MKRGSSMAIFNNYGPGVTAATAAAAATISF